MKKIIYTILTISIIGVGFFSFKDKFTKDKSILMEARVNEQIALTPPMGWNSFDAYDCRITEEEFKSTVDVMAEKLMSFGWEYVVIDYIWWHPEPGNWNTPRRKGHPNLRYDENGSPLFPEYITMDEYGRLLPAVERFPSAKNSQGFKPLADYVHSKGLKFGIHIMRGIHRYAAFLDTSIKGCKYSAKDIAEPYDTCGWCNHMFGVDASQPGAQEYYNSLFELYAQWEVDYIKADDILRDPFHKGEIELIRNAIDNCGRPMVLSLSPGEAPIGMADFLKDQANMWRISEDFWDKWEDLRHSFDLLNAWSPHAGPGNWPDADMIPFGRISLDDRPHGKERLSHFTEPEYFTLMNLWCIAKSPLMIGSDLLGTPDSLLEFYQNKEVLYVNQKSIGNRQIVGGTNSRVWIAEDPANGDVFLGLFNLGDQPDVIGFELEWAGLRGRFEVKDLWSKIMSEVEGRVETELPAHGSALLRLSSVTD